MNNIYEPDYVKKLFDQMSGSYERMNYVTSFGYSIRWRKQMLQKLGQSDQPLKVLDLLSGLGENWVYLKQHFPNAHFFALDFSEGMMARAQRKAQKVFKGNLNHYCEDVLYNELPDAHFDIISCAFGLKTFNPEQLHILAGQINRLLKPGGKFCFIEVSKPTPSLLQAGYRFYLGKMIPVIGKLFLGNPDDYKMLWIYTRQFENSKQVKEIFTRQGLEVNYDQYLFGCATGISGVKTKGQVLL
ncbi:ubiquinone biosynthesis protein [Taibaiella sp. KBW10]|uniref:class I SAM-dependent methyltransferase n=1 Tax=Taibaiella sp. KBW10 TaxID=2153357 RepID=UPI000F59A399|nr:class I SAM-dependent methyltransferase [Taibaiella sp. KBW10]RQO30040.1 ubiquinone biosynthesis protein [Taibaiella sp. KBW10]